MAESKYWQRKRLGRRAFVAGSLAAGAGVVSLAVAGCGDDDDDETPTATSTGTSTATSTGTSTAMSTGTATATATATQAVKKGGTFRWADNDPPTWHPFGAPSATMSSMSSMVRDSLVEPSFEAGTDPWDTVMKPSLAKEWEQPDDLTYVFTLDERAKYANIAPVNGRKFVADDVVYSFKTMLASKNFGQAGFFASIADVTAPDDATVEIKMAKPYAPQLTYIGSHWMHIVAPEMDAQIDQPQGMVGTGFMIFEGYQPGVGAQFRANPDHWRGAPNLDGAEVLIINDANSRISQFKSGNLHLLTGVPQDVLPSAVEGTGDIDSYAGTFSWLLTARNDIAPFNTPDARRALALGLDRETFFNAFLGGESTIDGDDKYGGVALLPQETQFFVPKSELGEAGKYLEYHPEEARALAQSSGIAGMSMDISTYATDPYRSWVEAMAQMLNGIGLNLAPKPIDRGQYIQSVIIGNYEGIAFQPVAVPFDPDDWLVYWRSDQPRNNAKVNDATVDELFEKQRTSLVLEDRQEAWAEFQKYVADKCYYMFGPPNNSSAGVNSKVRNFKQTPFYFRRDMRFVWFDA